MKPTIVFVHGAFADSSSWNGVIPKLQADGFTTIAAANPLRSVTGDAASVSDLVSSIDGKVILVGHSYGGMVINEVAIDSDKVTALVFVSAFIPEAGESALQLSSKFPGSTLGNAIKPVSLATGGEDFYVQPGKFHHQFAADVSPAVAGLMAATQRPVTKAALEEAARGPGWKNLPVYAIYGTGDLNIPPEALAFMATRAHAVQTVAIPGASHAISVSNPDQVVQTIEAAAAQK